MRPPTISPTWFTRHIFIKYSRLLFYLHKYIKHRFEITAVYNFANINLINVFLSNATYYYVYTNTLAIPL